MFSILVLFSLARMSLAQRLRPGVGGRLWRPYLGTSTQHMPGVGVLSLRLTRHVSSVRIGL